MWLNPEKYCKKKEESFSKICRTGPVNKIYIFYNKKPIWNEENETYGLHFKGKSPMPSVRNFQISENDTSIITKVNI